MSIPTREIRLKSRPIGLPSLENFDLVKAHTDMPKEGQVLVRNLWMSVDPYMRGRMVDRETYIPPFALGEALDGSAVGVVVHSADPALLPGDVVVHFSGWREHALIDASTATKIADPHIAPQTYLSALGFPGLTAYAGLTRIADLNPGDTIFVSAASGAVGSIVCQIAKIKGARGVASVGSADKARWLLEEIGVDGVVNYRESSELAAALAAVCPQGIDVYFDNVGGAHLEAALAVANTNARFVLCGMISAYNSETPPAGPRNIYAAIEKRITLHGLLGADHFDLAPDFNRDMAAWIKEGKVKVRETIVEGLEKAPEAFIGLFKGANVGKMLVRLGEL